MSLPKFNEDVHIISKLDDEPNDVGGLSADELKAKFDEASVLMKEFINDTLLPYLEGVSGAGNIGIANIPGLNDAATVQAALLELKTQLNNTSTGSIPDRSLSGEKLVTGAVGTNELANASVTYDKIANASVDDSKISVEKLSGASIQDKAIENRHFNGKVIKAENVEDNTLTGDQMKDLSIPAGKLGSSSVQTSKLANDAVTRAKLASDVKVLSFTNKTVATSAWVSDTTYTDFPYRAAVACQGVTVKHYAEVVFSPTDALEGIFCPVAASYDGGVYIYASEIPEAALTIPTIVCTPVE